MNVPELLGDGWIAALADAFAGIEVSEAADGVAQVTVSGVPAGRLTAFHIIVGEGRVSVIPGRYRGPDVVLAWALTGFTAVWEGDLSVEEAYMEGTVKVDGDRILLIDGWRPVRMSHEVRSALKALGAASSCRVSAPQAIVGVEGARSSL